MQDFYSVLFIWISFGGGFKSNEYIDISLLDASFCYLESFSTKKDWIRYEIFDFRVIIL
jgi:hypothetical protein